MIATPPACTAVRLQNTNRNAGGLPYASRSTWYWPPATGRIRPSSANVIAPSNAITPPTPHAIIAPLALPVTRATSRGLKKMPTPMIAPTTTQVASHRPSTRGRARSCPGPATSPPWTLGTDVLDRMPQHRERDPESQHPQGEQQVLDSEAIAAAGARFRNNATN